MLRDAVSPGVFLGAACISAASVSMLPSCLPVHRTFLSIISIDGSHKHRQCSLGYVMEREQNLLKDGQTHTSIDAALL